MPDLHEINSQDLKRYFQKIENDLPNEFANIFSRYSQKTALIDGRSLQEYSYEFLDEHTTGISQLFRNVGLQKGDRLLISAYPSIELVITIISILRSDLVLVLANPEYTHHEVNHIISDANPNFVILDNENSILAIEKYNEETKSEIEFCNINNVEISNLIAHLTKSLELFKRSNEYSNNQVDDLEHNRPAVIAYTSGTTGQPKGAELSQKNLLANSLSLELAWRWTPDDQLILTLPIFHGHGLFNGIISSLLIGSSVRLFPTFVAQEVCEAAQNKSTTMFFGVPTIYQRLVDFVGTSNLSRLRLCVSGSAPLSEKLFQEFKEITFQEPLERYGTTESMMSISNPYFHKRVPGSIGIPLPGVNAKLVNDEIYIDSPMVFSKYINDEEKTRDAFEGKWYKTGDLAEINEDGYFVIKGRSKEIIITGGFNVYPREVEETLQILDFVSQVAVVGKKSKDWGEQVTAFVVTDSKSNSNTLIELILEHCKNNLVNYKIPKEIIFVSELPRNALGKIVKSKLLD